MSADWRPAASVETLRARAEIIRTIRDWFYQHDILEVETPQLCTGATTDPNIESFTTAGRALRTSSEFHQKRLLAAGVGDNYELGKVFRVDESGRFHNPEFTMLEWYRLGIDHHALINEVEKLLQLLHGDDYPPFEKISYRQLWQTHAELDIATGDCDALIQCLTSHGVEVPASVVDKFDDLLDLGMATFITEALPANSYTCVYHYPASQASLARIDYSDASYAVACRFEIFYGSVELANGYYELTDWQEQLTRFESDNLKRVAENKPQRPIDYQLIRGLQHGLPQCAGVAIGIDRLLMILLGVDSIDQTLSFDWVRA